MGVTEFEYLSNLGTKMTGEARQILYNFLDKWDFDIAENLNNEAAVKFEAYRDIWRTWYKKISTWTFKQINTTNARSEPRRPDWRMENMLLEPPHLADFLAVLVTVFQAPAATYLDALKSF